MVGVSPALVEKSTEELEPLFDYSRVQPFNFVPLDDDDSDSSPNLTPKRKKLSNSSEEKNENVTQVIDCKENEEEDWLPPPPKLSVDVQNQLGEDSTLKQLRYSQIVPYLEYNIENTKLHVAITQICFLVSKVPLQEFTEVKCTPTRLKKQELLLFAESAKDVLRTVEESAKRELGSSLQSSVESVASQPSKPPCERAKIVISIQDKDGLKQFRIYMVVIKGKRKVSEAIWIQMEEAEEDLKVWNREVIGNVSLNKNIVLNWIGFWDAKERDCGLSLEDSEARRCIVEDFSKWVVMEEISWRQKSRELWLKEGVDGRKLTEETEIKKGVVNAFQNIFSETWDWRLSISELSFSFVDSVKAGLLEDAFSKEEIQTTLSSLSGDKAHGPDGFTLAFWQLVAVLYIEKGFTRGGYLKGFMASGRGGEGGADDKFERLFKMYADKLKLDLKSLIFCFDGDKISPTATPDELGMEDNDIVEVHIKSS
ncbi:hypothetical protein CK203_011720 [Vitis vinifera]|uniref:Rad60/SUMO-like domain-containing protein n=1 Tax=Vitis vinifera TaxID=29760 RepID=A0A438JUK4_VITVI|nr:hypothetical protein CK203_011720 [Vitis vinifera]